MRESVKVFGSKKKEAWVLLRNELLKGKSDKVTWGKILDLLDDRLNTRYFTPIERILLISKYNGEGFAVMTLICSLIEFLQTTYEGKYFNEESDANPYSYGIGKSKIHFTAFLTTHEPFKIHFCKITAGSKKTYAEDFYNNVRCGLLHEAATRSGWVIKVGKGKTETDFVDLSDETNKIIYRNLFLKQVKNYIDKYKFDVLNDTNDLRNALCRKFDKLCEIHSAQESWWG